MADDPIDPTKGLEIFTDRGLEKIRDAAVSETQVKIKFVALGDANGTPYDPTPDQTALVNERLRKEIEGQYPAGPKGWLTKTSWPPETDTVIIREMGFADEDGELICIWAGAQVERFSQTGAHEYLLEHTLLFEGVRTGLIIVDAPLDEVMAFMKTTNANFALAFHDIFKLKMGAAQ